MSSPAEDDDELVRRPLTQRVVSAIDSSPLHSTAASSVFNTPFGLTSTPDPDPEPEPPAVRQDTATPQPPEEGEPMAQKKGAARARKSSRGNPHLQICSALLQEDLSRPALAEALPSLKAAQISSGLHTAKATGRVKFVAAKSVYTITGAGRAWANAATGGETAAAEVVEKPARAPAQKSASHRRGRRVQPKEPAGAGVDTSPVAAAPRAFRCAVYSDGGFFLAKGDQRIELDAGEHAEMLAYLERMAEEQTA